MSSRPALRAPRPQGTVLSSPLVLLSVVAVLMAGLAFVLTRGEPPADPVVAAPVRSEASDTPSPATPTPTTPEPKPRPPVQRATVGVDVYNNTGISGLASSVGQQASEAGWEVVATDNWYGTIPSNTVYFPPSMERAAKQLALDLGITRSIPAVDPMSTERLTVILTSEL